MPEVSWDDFNDVIHRIKGNLSRIALVEVTCKKIRQDMVEEIDKLHVIILKHVNKEEEKDAC